MGLSYYTSRGIEPYVTPDNKVGVRPATQPGTDQWSAPTSTPQQAQQMAYVQSNPPQRVQAQQIADQQIRNAQMGVSQAEYNRMAYLQSTKQPIDLPGGQAITGFFKLPTNQRPNITPYKPPTTLEQYDAMGGGQTPVTKAIKSGGMWTSERLEAIVPKTDIVGLKSARAFFTEDLPMMPSGIISQAQFWFSPTNRVTTPEIKRLQMEQAIGGNIAAIKADPLDVGVRVAIPMIIAGGLGKGVSSFRARGLTDIPIESIGYETKVGYPKVPGTPKVADMAKSFETRQLVPKPVEMSTGEAPPYQITKPAALPTDIVGSKYAYTGWENAPKPTKFMGKTYELGKGSSEIPGASAAPVVEAYFTKAGGKMPEVIGLEINPLKSPTIIRWELQDIKVAPQTARSDFAAANRFVASEKVNPGTGYIFGLKGEYEINIPMGNQFQIAKTQYRTTVGGFGKSRILGTKVPILEAKTTGVMNRAGVKTPVEMKSYYSAKPKPLINVAYSGLYSPRGASSIAPSSKQSSRISISKMPSTSSAYKRSYYLPSSAVLPSKGSPGVGSSGRTRSYTPPSSPPPSPKYPPSGPPPYTPPGYTPPSYTPPSYTPPYTPPRETKYTPPVVPRYPPTGGSRIPVPLGASGRKSGRGHKGMGIWKGTTITNKVIGFKEFFGDLKAPKEKTKKRKWGII